jgi:hypothetical protein
MSLRNYRVSNLLIWTCVASFDEFCIFEKLLLHLFQIWALTHALATRGRKKGWEKLHCIPRTYPNSQRGSCAFLLHFWLLGVWFAVLNRSDRFWETTWPVWWNRPDRFVLSVSTCLRGVCICAEGALVCYGGLCSLLKLVVDSVVSSCCPCLRGPSLSSC